MSRHAAASTLRAKSGAQRLLLSAAAFAAATACQHVAAQGVSRPDASAHASGRILVMPRAGVDDAAFSAIVKEHGGTRARKLGKSGLSLVDLPPGTEQQVVERLARHPHVKFAELDQKANPSLVPNDPYFGSEWHIAKIGAPSAWDVGQGAGVTIAIVDTGVESSHPDLVGALVPGWNFYDNNADTSPVNGHGTWVAGTAGATSNNGAGVASVAGNAKLMPLRVVDGSGVGYWSSIAQAITYAADHGVRVVNASFEKLLNSSSVMSAAAYMKSKGGLVVVAAGNNGADEALTPNTAVIPVSATDSNDQITSWSSYGSYVAMSAPGVPIYTTGLSGSYVQGQGTSFSAPIVAGTLALMMSANPKLANTEVEKLLYSTAVDLGAAGRDKYYGYGRVDAGAAVRAAAGAVTTTDNQPPTASITAPGGSMTVAGLVPIDAIAQDNVGVTKVELRVNGALVAADTAAPFGFSWDSTRVGNGMVSLTVTAYDAAGNVGTSAPVSVNVANAIVADSVPPVVQLTSPTSSTVRGKGGLTVSATATDNSGSAGITQRLYIDGALKTTATGGSLSYSWSLNKVSTGSHTITVVATDMAGNSSSASTQVAK